jgi:His-Xaa-Ser system protein HxsD
MLLAVVGVSLIAMLETLGLAAGLKQIREIIISNPREIFMPNLKTRIDLKNNTIVFWLDSKIYPLEAVYNTAYVFLDQVYIFLDGNPEKEIEIYLKGKKKLDKKKLEALQGEFLNELLNFLLRIEVAQNNQKIREYIVASALVSSLPSESLTQSPFLAEAETANWKEDPLGIAVPWEEKRKEGKKKTKKKDKK